MQGISPHQHRHPDGECVDAENVVLRMPMLMSRWELLAFFVRGVAWSRYIDALNDADRVQMVEIRNAHVRYEEEHARILNCARKIRAPLFAAASEEHTLATRRAEVTHKCATIVAFDAAMDARIPIDHKSDLAKETVVFVDVYERIEDRIVNVSDFKTLAALADEHQRRHEIACAMKHRAWDIPTTGLVMLMGDPDRRSPAVIALAFGYLNSIRDEYLIERLALPEYVGRGLIRAFPALYTEFLRARWPGFGSTPTTPHQR